MAFKTCRQKYLAYHIENIHAVHRPLNCSTCTRLAGAAASKCNTEEPYTNTHTQTCTTTELWCLAACKGIPQQSSPDRGLQFEIIRGTWVEGIWMVQQPWNTFVQLKQRLGDNAHKFEWAQFIWAVDKDGTLEGEGEWGREGKGARTLFAAIDIEFQVLRGKCGNKENIF